ncbi:MAG: hypothetical protein GAK33_04935 [Burkholderia lata]|uniref:Uncharacterized protein n=1 Tax=Burkholderia lata (strain ATCC 17760 / DSM 23089 / LMG 22485 / NCIMB 9086 / R18194 / 383) TaxID=482957 RepID=A0A833PR37_BURL3|nr:MAG: hypothetical protein GAK33_04935 [Burkholderia lata]
MSDRLPHGRSARPDVLRDLFVSADHLENPPRHIA